MWTRFINFLRSIAALIGHLFGQKPRVSSDDGVKPVETVVQPVPTKPKEDIELFKPSKYDLIDWENNPPPYRKKNEVLTFQERKFFYILTRSVRRNHQILSMVRMADVIKLSKEIEDYRYHNNNILCKHFDFVICDTDKFKPLLVIELDDSRHGFIHRRKTDVFKEKACKEAGIELIRFDVKGEYNEEKIAEIIHQKLTISN